MIVPNDENAPEPEHVITGVAGKVGFSAIYIEKALMNGQLGFGRRVLQVLEDAGISFEHLPSGIDTMTVVVETAALESHRDAILASLNKKVQPDHLYIHDDLALIAVVGRGMVRTQGTAFRVFKALAEAKVNVRMIDQGSSERNIIVGIAASDYAVALDAVYHEFVK